jgi:hypothetical protein
MAIKSRDAEHKPHNDNNTRKKGIGFGAFAGFIGGIVFTGIIMALSLVFYMPTGIFLHALGSLVVQGPSRENASLVGMAALAIILVQGVVIGIIFGIVTSMTPKLYPSKKKGILMGLITGFIAYLVIYCPMIFAIFPTLLSSAVVTFPESSLSLFGLHYYNLTTTKSAYFAGTLATGLVAYLVYGAIMGGVVSMEYSAYWFISDRRRMNADSEAEDKGEYPRQQ